MSADLLPAIFAAPERCLGLSMAEWELALGQARRGMLLGRLAAACSESPWFERLPAQPRMHLVGALRAVARQRLEVRWEIRNIAAALRDPATPVVFLKGAAYELADLPPARGRLYADVDILVPRERLDEVEGALFRAGWISRERDAYNQRYYRQWMHELPPLVHVRRETYLDVHHTITPPTSRFRVDAGALFERIEPVAGMPGLHVLSLADMILHSAVHLFQEGEFANGLRDLLDLADLIGHAHARSGFQEQLVSRAVQLGLARPLFYAVSCADFLLPGRMDAGLVSAVEPFRPRGIGGTAMLGILRRALRPDHPSCDDAVTRVARNFLYVRAHHLRMPAHLLLPHLLRKAYMRRFPPADAPTANA
ncbi:MAG: nucleotidyltransferase family protein [Burkholderiales bacterium]|nr:nucleotidyltransferase family protein [Burkholderiales bacterium]